MSAAPSCALVATRPPARSFPANAHKATGKPRGPVPERAPELIQSGADLVSSLRRVRQLMGVTQREFDDLAGWADGYTGKLEQPAAPYGKSCTMPSFDEWLQAAGVALVMVKLPKGARTSRDLAALPAVLAVEPLRGQILWAPFAAPVEL
jgi:hypothetical protein